MIITVFSGKGGTGKTTVSTNLFNVLKDELDVQLVDVDVEEPDTHIFFDVDFSWEESVDVLIPEVDEERCTRCGVCAQECQFGAIAVGKKSVVVFPTMCHGCGVCSMVCPVGAIAEVPRSIGTVRVGRIKRESDYIMGVMNIGELSGMRIVREVKKKIDSSKVVIIDAPPGISCPVIESLKGVDFALLVTEPSPFGVHDLKLAIETTKALSIPSAIVVNRYMDNGSLVEDVSKAEGIPIFLKIPFSRKFAEIYSMGRLITEYDDRLKDSFRGLYDSIAGVL